MLPVGQKPNWSANISVGMADLNHCHLVLDSMLVVLSPMSGRRTVEVIKLENWRVYAWFVPSERLNSSQLDFVHSLQCTVHSQRTRRFSVHKSIWGLLTLAETGNWNLAIYTDAKVMLSTVSVCPSVCLFVC